MECAAPFPSLSMENQIKCYLLATDDKVGACNQAKEDPKPFSFLAYQFGSTIY